MQSIEVNAAYIHHIVGVMKERFKKDTIILFHVDESYECFGKDSAVVSQKLGIPSELYLEEEGDFERIYVTRFPACKLIDYRKVLTDEGYVTVTNETRNAEGKHILKIYEPEQRE